MPQIISGIIKFGIKYSFRLDPLRNLQQYLNNTNFGISFTKSVNLNWNTVSVIFNKGLIQRNHLECHEVYSNNI